MAKICLTRPQSTGTYLYGSQRAHRGFVSLRISVGNCGDHVFDRGDDTGFKGAHDSEIKRVVYLYDKTKPSISKKDERGPDGKYRVGSFIGTKLVPAPEIAEGTILEVSMSFEQFAEMLTSTGHQVDCTIYDLHSVGKSGEHYREEVLPPPPVSDRMKRRLENAHEEALGVVERTLVDLEGWNATKKVKEIVHDRLNAIRRFLVGSQSFAVAQANEELSAVAESAVSIIHDKVLGLEADGRLPKGSAELFRSGGATSLLGLNPPGGD